MRNLTPAFILHQLANGRTSGEFDTVCLFLDISGFTPLTSRLMQHGTEGAEVLADVLNATLEPLIEAVFAHGGFVAGFAGDAIKAVFPVEQPDAYTRAVSAASEMITRLCDHAAHQTRFGSFDFAGKVCIADGRLGWRVWQHMSDAATVLDQRAAVSFFGPALDIAMQLDPFCGRGEIVLTAAVCTMLRKCEGVKAEAIEGGHFRLLAWPPRASAGGSVTPDAIPAPLHALAAAFVPDVLLAMPTVGEFRRVTSLFINCRPMADGQTEAHFFDGLFSLLDRYGGYLCRVGRIGGKDSGTTLLVFFGAPAGYEDDPVRALAFLLDLQRASPTSLRAGVTTSRAYAGFVGSPLGEEYTCHSIDVNQAARQMVAADWGEFWLDETTTARAQHLFQIDALGARLFKGFAEPRPVYRLSGRRGEEAETFYSGELIGREQEMDGLLAALAPMRQRRFGGAVYVVGDAGIGKSRLVHAFKARAESSHAFETREPAITWLLGQTDGIVRQPLDPFRYMLRTYFLQTAGDGVEQNRSRLSQTLDNLIAASDDPSLAAALTRSHSFLAALVDLTWEGSLYEQLDPRLRLENTLDALKALFKAESLRRPLVLHIEDAHMLDAESRGFLHQLTRNVEDCPFLLVLTARAEGEYARAASGDALTLLDASLPQTTIYLQGLVRAAVASLGRERLAGDLAPSLLDLLVARAEGNPFFTEQILLYLFDREQLIATSDGWDINDELAAAIAARDVGAVEAALPSDVESVLTARLDRLPAAVRQVVQTAAVLGREFDQGVLAHMLEHRDLLAEEMAVATQAMLWAPLTQTRYIFRHALLRDAAYGMQLRGQLRKLHHTAAAALRTIHARELAPHYAELVHHYHQSEDDAAERDFAALAGAYAATQYANGDAIRFYSRALALTPADARERRLEVILARERIHEIIGDHDSQRGDLELLDELARDVDDRRAQATVSLRRAGLARLTGEYVAALDAAARALAIARTSDAADMEAACLLLSGRVMYQQGDFAPARQVLERALTIARRASLHAEEAQILNNLGITLIYSAAYDEARNRLSEAHDLSRALRDPRTQISCLQNLGMLDYRVGRFISAQEYRAQALELCHAIGWRYGEAYLLASLGNTGFDLGDFGAAHRYHVDALTVCRELQDREGEALSLDTLGMLAALSGDFSLARVHFRSALEIQRALGDLRSAAFTLTHWGFLLAELGEFGPAAKSLDEALALRLRLGEERAAIDTRAGLAWAMHRLGDASARNSAAALVGWLEANGTDGVEFPAKVCVLCYQVLTDSGRGQPADVELALTALRLGRDVLHARAEQIQDDALRRRFLKSGYGNAELLTLCTGAGLISA